MVKPRPEYPRPQLVRGDWCNLNGEWEFEIDSGKSGRDRRLYEAAKLNSKIIVPFCPESELSGVNNKDFMPCVWYRRELDIGGDALSGAKRVILHFGAADYDTEVWVNGKSVGTHIGGYVGFSFDITSYLTEGKNSVAVCCEDELRSGRQPYGKQCYNYHSGGCSYTRTTGIWQTVWLEIVPNAYIEGTRFTPDLDSSVLFVELNCKNANGKTVSAEASYDGKIVGYGEDKVAGERAYIILKLSELHLWNAGQPNLYDLKLKLDGDNVQSYFGMREIAYENGKMYINGKPVFQRLILDQGFYPDGIYTAPTDAELEGDIVRSMDMGFNGARLHQKIFEPRFLYHCDRLGYIVWGEHASWGLDISRDSAYKGFIPEWLEALKRDYNHPSIVGWCPLNETSNTQDKYLLRTLYTLTKQYDSTRPVIDTSGYIHVVTDIVDCHDYDQNPESFKARYSDGGEGDKAITFVSEYGGIWWDPENPERGWGYGNRPASPEEFIARYKGLCDALLDNPRISAFCYTQLTNVEQEVNGLYTYDRKPKFDPAVIKAITSRAAAIEK
ncbi:MAG: sugar-binding domain-containing protein [Eubacteriales bacterium]